MAPDGQLTQLAPHRPVVIRARALAGLQRQEVDRARQLICQSHCRRRVGTLIGDFDCVRQ